MLYLPVLLKFHDLADVLADDVKLNIDNCSGFYLVEIRMFIRVRNNGNFKAVFLGIYNR